MEKNALIAIVLSFLIIFAYYTFFTPAPPKKEEPQVKKEQPAPLEEKPVAPVPLPAPREKAGPLALGAGESKVAKEAAPAGKRIKVETSRMAVIFDSLGASPISWQLKEYKDKPGKAGKPLEMLGPSSGAPGSTSLGVALVSAGPSGGGGDDQGRGSVPVSNFGTEADSQILTRDNQQAELLFSAELPQGIRVSADYTFSGNQFAVPFTLTITNSGQEPWSGRPVITLSRGLITQDGKGVALGYVGYGDGSIKREMMEKAGREDWSVQKLNWFGIDEQYFLVSLLLKDPGEMKVQVERKEDGLLVAQLAGSLFTLPPGQSRALKYTLFFGPKDLDILKSLGSELDKAIDFGWSVFVARPLLQALKFLYSGVGNYGWAIILLTVGIKIIFFPLTEKSFRSMQKMQKLQPLMAQLREKYKDDKVQLNREIMDLYKRYKVNPVSGCLPMLIQMPVLYALYVILMWGIELRHAPFIFWIQDLSAKDPTYITPILMGGSMFLQQKMTPSMGDPMQAKMMLMMPVIFTIMFLSFPSGLVIYWLVNNLLSIGHQSYTNYRLKSVPEVVK